MTITADLGGRVAIVTGASSGLGRHFCSVLSGNGAQVVAAARRIDRLEHLVADGAAARAVECDVTNDGDVGALVAAAVELGGPHIVVNAAGFGDEGDALEVSVDEFRRTLDVDLTATFAVSQAAAKEMGSGGAIINIASILGLGASWPVKQAAYCAAKGGVINLTRQLGAEWAGRDIRVNAIAPGWFPSEITEEMFENEKSLAWIRRNTPMRRPGRLDELDGALLLLATSTFITGQVLAVDGGWSAR
ncbi:MAG TPA: SDR family oxidoreductase [Gordonia sp. (in: high G+C Gram-positive bacteria)]|uniref:SDR family NAD(P)-dependent oxidoreductase n=1 Tax=unclassified Gordonia (in: high G+C Gram-positive bacteria) TaxID=2657482 RepID=UPI000FA630CA|nr:MULTISPECIES: SDR family oxidoreductase [unclassified Gordonia (in: high G+C Gram-positive bacteria)]RUP37798.1 MAG: SDR family oxidoreductase [Gordonia sp. (in: high G+C Gram-positive bacteria)]HNP55346.1 SDR family oxidoreductase [Gordonia sp. (in: high G+C Gram-positive bacteria)]HRC50082.1 SDR family oxidoreductase [Gordonia sp. (in: high G+C Gram-positive bacteria)]